MGSKLYIRGSTFPCSLMHAWPQPKKWTPALTQGLSNKMLMLIITGSLFTDRGDQYGTFKKMKGQNIFYDQWEYGTTVRRHMVP